MATATSLRRMISSLARASDSSSKISRIPSRSVSALRSPSWARATLSSVSPIFTARSMSSKRRRAALAAPRATLADRMASAASAELAAASISASSRSETFILNSREAIAWASSASATRLRSFSMGTLFGAASALTASVDSSAPPDV